MSNEFKLKDILAAIDLDGKEVWDELSDDQKKSVVFYTLNRYMSNVKGSRELQEHYVLLTNEFFNKHLFSIISKHPKLTWQTACATSHESKKIHYHEWIGLKREKNKKVEFLAELFPNVKLSDLETLAAISTDKEIKEYCEGLGWDKKTINGIKL
jgi:uncharacterized Fe-S center protein